MAIENCLTLSELVSTIWEKTRPNREECVAQAKDLLAGHPKDLLRLLNVDSVLAQAVNEAACRDRRMAKEGARPSANGQTTSASAGQVLGPIMADFLRDFNMPDGRSVGEWTGPELIVQAAKDRAIGKGLFARARWEERLAKLAGQSTVRKKVSSKEARRIVEAAEREDNDIKGAA